VTQGLYASITGGVVEKGRGGHPVVEASVFDMDQFISAFNKRNGTKFRSLTEAQWECGARGEVVDLRNLMEIEGIRESDFVDWAQRRFENVFAHRLGSTIYTDFTKEAFQAVLHSSFRLYGYSVFGHPEGLDGEKVWFNKGEITSVTDKDSESRANSFHTIDMPGNVWEWVADRYGRESYHTLSPIDPVNQNGEYQVFRGGSGFDDDSDDVRAASRGRDLPGHHYDDLGFRMALAGH